MRVHVSSGIGAWTATTTVFLVACPHVGDEIDVKGVTVHCDVVVIGSDDVWVRETRRFVSEDGALELQRAWE